MASESEMGRAWAIVAYHDGMEAPLVAKVLPSAIVITKGRETIDLSAPPHANV